jgi:predicted Holliday junction resolvase-like endonuclease
MDMLQPTHLLFLFFISALVMVVAIVGIVFWHKGRERELQFHQDMRTREMEHQRQMRELELELEKEKNRRAAEKAP